MSQRERLKTIIGDALGDANNGNLNKFIAEQVIAAGFSRPPGIEEGIWTMTESEFSEEQRKAKEIGWEEGWHAGAGWPQVDDNPYRSRS